MNNGTNYGDGGSEAGSISDFFTEENGNLMIVRCTVAKIPSGIAGYAIGCLLQATDSGNQYTNKGTVTSCNFVLLDSGTAFSLPTSATDTTTTTSGSSLLLNFNAITTAFGLNLSHSTSIIASGGSISHVFSNTADTATTTGSLEYWHSTSSTIGTQLLGKFDALTSGIGLSLSALDLNTGSVYVALATAATLTTGRYYSANDTTNGEVFGIGLNGHIISTPGTSPTIAVTTQNGITAAALGAGSSDTSGIITTTGTNNNGGNTQITVTFGKTYTTAPSAVMITAYNASGALQTWFVTPTATTFVLNLVASATAGATPSYGYLVIA